MTYAQELGLPPPPPDGKPDPKAIAHFLKNTPGLSKSAIGEFLSKGPADQHPLNAAVLQQYVETFDFSHMSFDEALRSFLARFRLPGEAQCIDRLMEAFAKRLFEQVGPGNPFANADAVFILAFSTIMLNTDLHNPQIQDSKRMKLEEFIRNNKGINGGADLPMAFLEDLYHKIKAEEIQVQKDLRDVVGMEDADFSRLENLLNGDNQNQLTAASFTPTLTARKHIFPAGIHEKDMFMAFCDGILVTMLKVWTICDDNILLLKILEVRRRCAETIACLM
jgi:brefeldin A-resistance guanine nucleotide exchange factor 1